MRIAGLYALFALIAMIVNVVAQESIIRTYSGKYEFAVSVTVGTAVGLLVKYFLDKIFIFKFSAKNSRQEGIVFILYSIMGIFTTIIFWISEYIFKYFYGFNYRYIGAIIGLTVGYCVKYQLDKRYVFR